MPWHAERLEQLLATEERLAPALLVRGPTGIGKHAFACALCAALLCEEREPGRPACRHCRACRWFEAGMHPDFRTLEPQRAAEEADTGAEERKARTQILVDQVREIADFLGLAAHRGGAKVILIHPAEAMNASAANALLKNLEEPPPRTYFVLVSHRWHRLLPTITSRCRQIALEVPRPEAARAWLAAQGVGRAELALAQAGGAPLAAAGFDSEYWESRARFFEALAAQDFDPLRAAEGVRDVPLARVVRWLQQWSYDLALHGLREPRYSADLAPVLARAAARVPRHAALRFHRRMLGWNRIVDHPLSPRLALESLLLSYAALLRGTRAAEL